MVKVVAMMTGELDTADAVILSNNTLFNKIVFVFFIMIMCIVVMNMVLGLAISDINELRKIAHVRKLAMLVAAIQRTENVLNRLQLVLPKYSQLTQNYIKRFLT